MSDNRDKLHANGAVIEPGPAVEKNEVHHGFDSPVYPGTNADLDLLLRQEGVCATQAHDDIEWDGTSLVPPYEQPSTETLFRALEFRFREQEAELRAMRLRAEKAEGDRREALSREKMEEK